MHGLNNMIRLSEAIKLKPDLPQAHVNLGNAYERKREYDKAIEAYNQALAIDPNHKKAKENLELAKNLKTEQK
jgi:tetratricopeptide (TPR) repeat protein